MRSKLDRGTSSIKGKIDTCLTYCDSGVIGQERQASVVFVGIRRLLNTQRSTLNAGYHEFVKHSNED